MSVTLSRSPFRRLPGGGIGLIRRPFGNTVPIAPAAPSTPNTPSPTDTTTTLYSLLSWVASGQAWADIYFGTAASPPLFVSGYVGTTYVPTLLPSTTYYWKIVASNAGGSATGPIWSFTTPAATELIVTFDGVRARDIRYPSLSIRDALNAQPNTADLIVRRTAPTGGTAVKIGVGLLDAPLLFAGKVQNADDSYRGKPSNPSGTVALIDSTFELNKRRPFGTWTNVSVTTIGRYLVAVFGPGFTSTHIQDGLPTVSINFDGSDDLLSCLSRLASMIGGYAYPDYENDVHLFLTEPELAPDPLNSTNTTLLKDPSITFRSDDSQLRTRIYGKGHGEKIPCDLAAGETMLPLPDTSMNNAFGGQVVAGTTPDGAQTQILTYTAVHLGGVGSLAGPGAAPSVAPALALAGGVGLTTGVYQYAYTDVTPSGESLPSPLASITAADALTPPGALTPNAPTAGTPFVDQGNHDYVVTFVTAVGETLPGTASVSVTTTPTNQVVPLSNIPLGGPTVTKRKVYRRFNGAGTYKLVTTLTNNTATTFGDGVQNAALGADAPSVDTSAAHQVTVSGIAVGASPTTDRKLYRTVVAGSQLKLVTTIAGDVTTTYTDSTADGALGANVPSSDTSGLTQPTGQITAGSTSLLMASAGPFYTTGGWALIGSQIIRYTGVSGNSLTGIPASGIGALINTVLHGEHVNVSPALLGLNANNGLPLAMQKGSKVNIWVQRNDLAAQAEQIARDLAKGRVTDGIREDTIVDERRGEDSLVALCDAHLAIFSRPIRSTTYDTRDRKTRTGKTVHIDLPSGGYASAVFHDTPLGYWRLGESSGVAAADSSGHAYDGVIVGGVTLGQDGALSDSTTAALFNGSTGKVTVASTALNLTGALSIEAWVKQGTLSSDGGIAGTSLPTYLDGYALTWHTDGKVYFYIGAGSNNAGAAVPSTGWHHVVATWDGTTGTDSMKLYVDGLLAATHTSSTAVIAGTAFQIGQGNTYFNGSIDEVTVYPVVLTPAQIADHFARRTSTITAFALGPIGDYVLQQVEITCDDPPLGPRYHVDASSVAFTFSDFLRRALIAAS